MELFSIWLDIYLFIYLLPLPANEWIQPPAMRDSKLASVTANTANETRPVAPVASARTHPGVLGTMSDRIWTRPYCAPSVLIFKACRPLEVTLISPVRCHVGTAENLMRENCYSQFLLLRLQGEVLLVSCPTPGQPGREPNTKKLHAGSRDSTAGSRTVGATFEWLADNEGESHPSGCDAQIKCASRHAAHGMPHTVKAI